MDRTFTRKQNWITYCIVGILIIVGIYTVRQVYQTAQAMPGDCDETDWVYDTEFYDSVVLHRSTETPDLWRSIDAYDHPSVAKYVFGWYLSVTKSDYPARRVALRDQYGSLVQCGITGMEGFMDYIHSMRQVTAAATVGSLLGLALLAFMLTGSWVAPALVVVLLSRNELFVKSMTRATWDSFYVFFFLWAVVLHAWSIRRKERILVAASSFAAAVSVLSKLTGALFYPGYALYLMCASFVKRMSWRHALVEFAMVLCISELIWLAFGTVFLRSSVPESMKFINPRISILNNQAHNRRDSLKSFPERIFVSYCLSIQHSCLPKSVATVIYRADNFSWPAVNGILFVFGLIYTVLKSFMKRDTVFLYFFCTGIIVIIVSLLFIYVPWDRYYLPLTIVVSLMQSLGLWYILLNIRVAKISGSYQMQPFFKKKMK